MITKSPFKLSFDDYDKAYDVQVFASLKIATDYYTNIVKPLAPLFNDRTLTYGPIIPRFLEAIRDERIYVMHDMPSEEFILRLANFINRKEN